MMPVACGRTSSSPGPRPPVDRVLERAGNRAVVFGGDEQQAVDAAIAFLSARASGG